MGATLLRITSSSHSFPIDARKVTRKQGYPLAIGGCDAYASSIVGSGDLGKRRSLKYIRLAAFLAGQPRTVNRLNMSLKDIEEVVGADLPANARFPSWWRNDGRRMHSRAWMTAGWEVEEMIAEQAMVVFSRRM